VQGVLYLYNWVACSCITVNLVLRDVSSGHTTYTLRPDHALYMFTFKLSPNVYLICIYGNSGIKQTIKYIEEDLKHNILTYGIYGCNLPVKHTSTSCIGHYGSS
jgi:hypothetical protein